MTSEGTTEDYVLADSTTSELSADSGISLVDAEKWVTLIGIPILLILGTAGNGLVILVLAVRKLRPHPTSLMLAFLAVFDTMVLWTGHFRMLYRMTYDFADFRSQSSFLCKFHTQLTYFSVSISVWILVLVTSHRLIAVFFPLQAKTLLTMRRTVISLAVLLVSLFLFNLHIYFTVGLVDMNTLESGSTPENSTQKPPDIQCYHMKATNHFMTFVWPKMDLITNSIVPFILLLFCNCTIIYKVRVGSSILAKEKDSKSQKANTAMTVMLLSVNLIFLITTGPFALYNTDAFRPWVIKNSDKDYFIYTVLYVIQGINSASNFYIYCLSGQKFREELKVTFTCSKRRQDSLRSGHSRTATTTMNTAARPGGNNTRPIGTVSNSTNSTDNSTATTNTNSTTTNTNCTTGKTAMNGHANNVRINDSSDVSNDVSKGTEEGGIVNPACDEEMMTKL